MSEAGFSFDSQSAADAADFLDGRSMVLRWLVAFLRHFDKLPEESLSSWRFYWRGDPGAGCALAHSFRNGTTYLFAEAGFDFESLRRFFCEDFFPERIIVDRTTAESWREAAPGMLDAAGRSLELRVLARPLEAGGGKGAGPVRMARGDEAGALRQFEAMHCREIGLEEIHSDFDSLIEAGLVYVVEEGGGLAGYVCSNLSDGKYVHVSGLYIAPAYRGSRLGAVLATEIARRIAQEHGAEALVDVYSDNTPAIRTYVESGYVIVGEGLETRYHSDMWR